MGGAPEYLWLVFRYPQQLRRGEPRHHDVAGNRTRFGLAALELDAFVRRPAVVPEYRWTQRPILIIQQGRAVHLSAETNGSHGSAQIRWQTCHGIHGRVPPGLGVLL